MTITYKSNSLTDLDRQLLRKIFEYSGYTTSISLNTYRNDKTLRNMQYFLNKMLQLGHLKKLQFYSDSRKDVLVYQVTGKTCRLFGNPDSYFRKKHEPTYTIRALVKQHFFFEICRALETNILANHYQRLSLLVDTIGFDPGILPKKHNKDTSFIHIEEYILNFLIPSSKELFCPASEEVLYDDREERLIIVYIDKYQVNPAAQLFNLVEKYRLLSEQEKIKLDFLVVVDYAERAVQYRNIICKRFGGIKIERNAQQIDEHIILYHRDILINRFHVPAQQLRNMVQETQVKYSQTQNVSKEELESMAVSVNTQDILEAIKDGTNAILNEDFSENDKLKKLTAFFRKIYRLYAAGMFDKRLMFDIKVYQIGYRFSL